MHHRIAAGVALGVVALTGAASIGEEPAAPVDARLPAVDSLSCEQIYAEVTARQRPISPDVGSVEAMQDEMAAEQRRVMGQTVGVSAACLVPGAGAVCRRAQDALADSSRARAEEQMERLNELQDEANNAGGSDGDRMVALTARWMSEGCRAP